MATSDPLIGQTLGDYVIQDLLGQGGMARVYKGYDSALDRYAAVKVIEPNLLASEDEEDYRQRFQREARSIARLDHPNIVSIYQFGQNETKTLYYMAMGFVDGQNMREVLKKLNQKKKHLNHAYILRIMRDIGSALDYAHRQGVIHRDVKTSNIMLTRSGQAVLTDFGLALNAQEGTLGNTFGSVHYIAPEQALSSKQAVPQSDLYSLGIVLFEMLTGRVPFEDVSAMSVALKHISDPPPMPSTLNTHISPQVEDVIMKALDKEPRKRFNTGQSFVMALEGAFAASDDEDTHDLESDSQPVWTSALAKEMLDPSDEENTDDQQSATRHSPPGVVTGRSTMDESPTIRDSSRKHPIFGEIEAKADTKHPQSTQHMREESDRGVVYALIGLFAAVVVLAVAGLLLVGGGDEGDGDTAAALGSSSTEPADVIPFEATEDPTLTPSDTPQPTNTPTSTTTSSATATLTATSSPTLSVTPAATEEPTAAITAEATAETTEEPTGAITVEATTETTEEPTAEATAETTEEPTAEATAETTEEPMAAITAEATAEPTPTPTEAQSAEIRLIYDGRTLVLLNQSERRLDLDGLNFVRLTSDGEDSLSYEVEEWQTRDIYNLRPGDCLQVWTTSFVELEDDEPPATACDSRVRFRQTIRSFWVGTEDHAAFEVRRDGAVLATCDVVERVFTIDHEGLPRLECQVSLDE